MSAESAQSFEALERQAARITRLFIDAGYELVAPNFIQPASLFLDRIGESIRARTYVFTDPSGEELCLRPDLTAPVCRLHVERIAKGARNIAEMPARYCYNGPAFRMQEGKPDPMRPREFRQAGIEYFGGDAAAADAEVISLTLAAVRAAGCSDFVLRLGHTGMFSALLTALPMPERWRGRLKRAFWRPRAFARELRDLIGGPRNGEDALLTQIGALSGDGEITEQTVLDYLDRENIALIGQRRPSEIAAILSERAADAKERPLSPEVARTIEAYLAVRGALPAALYDIRELGADVSRALAEPLDMLAGIHHAVKQAGVGEDRIAFAADFGRQIEYYTGFVFQIEIEVAGIAGNIAGGGRYDAMLRAISGGAVDTPAVGAAIHTERLLAAAGGARR